MRSAARRGDHSRFRPRTARAADRHHRLHEALPGAHHLRRIGVGDAGHADAGSRDPSGTSFAAATGAGQLRADRLPLRPARNSGRRAGSPADRRRRDRDLPRLGVPRNLPLRRRAAEPHLGGRRLHRSPELPGLHLRWRQARPAGLDGRPLSRNPHDPRGIRRNRPGRKEPRLRPRPHPRRQMDEHRVELFVLVGHLPARLLSLPRQLRLSARAEERALEAAEPASGLRRPGRLRGADRMAFSRLVDGR